MVTVNDLSNFSGNQGEDASRWFRSFVLATRGDSESVMLRMFPTYLEPESPAMEWYDGLSDDVIATWIGIERKFRQRWVSRTGGQAKGEESSVERFRKHRLTDDIIFTTPFVNVDNMRTVIIDWVNNHLQLGVATGLDNETLMQETTPNLPAFLRAFLKCNPTPPITTFQMLCTRIKEIEDLILEFEQLRRQEKDLELLSELVGTVKKLHDDIKKPSGSKSCDFEQQKTRTATATTGEKADDTTLFSLPEEWKKTAVSVNKAEMVDITKELIRTVRRYTPSGINVNAARMVDIGLLQYCNTIKVPDQFHSISITGETGEKSTVLLGLYQTIYQHVFNGFDNVTEVNKTWGVISGGSSHIIEREGIYRTGHTEFKFSRESGTYLITSNSTPYHGGFAQSGDGIKFAFLRVSSFGTALCLLLSVYLAECVTTGDRPYKQAALDAGNWLVKWAYDEGTHLVKSFTWDMDKGQVWGSTLLSPDVTGLFIEGLSVLASLSGEKKWRNLAIDICNAAMVHRGWHDDEGVFKYVSPSGALAEDEENMFRGLLVRGLSVAYQRNPTNQELRHKIRSYINLQFNGIREFAHYRGSYGAIWSGPYVGPNVYAEMAALNLFMAAVIVNYY